MEFLDKNKSTCNRCFRYCSVLEFCTLLSQLVFSSALFHSSFRLSSSTQGLQLALLLSSLESGCTSVVLALRVCFSSDFDFWRFTCMAAGSGLP